MAVRTRIDVIAKQFERGLQCAGCSESNIARIVELIKQKKIDAISLYASDDGFKVYELFIGIDWNEYNKQQKAGNDGQADSIGGLQISGETIEVETYLDDLVRKSRERKLRLSYWISFCGALRIRNPEEYYRLKSQLGFENSLLGWMNDLGRDEVDFIPDLQELKIRIRDIRDVDAFDSNRIKEKKALLLKCEKVAEQLSCSNGGATGDYFTNKNVFPVEVSLTFQGEKKAAMLLGITSLNDPTYAELKQGIVFLLTRKEEKRIAGNLDNNNNTQNNTGITPNSTRNRKPGPNDPCPCGSGLKHKNCHGKNSGNTSAKIPNKDLNKIQCSNKPIQAVSVANNTDKEPHNKIKRIKISLLFNSIIATLIIAILAVNKFAVPASPWDYITRLVPLVAWVVYYFAVAIPFDEEYGCSKKYNKALYVVLVAVSLISICSIILTKLDKEIVIFSKILVIAYNLYYVPIFALSTISCMKYLNETKCSDRNITVFRKLSYILCSVLAVFVLIGTVKQVKGWNVLNVGDTVYFGVYEQDGDPSNGKEEISWTVHSIENGKALLLSDVCLYSMPYNASGTDNSWTNSDLRKWLNGEFYQSAFSSAERGVICDEEINTKKLSVEDLANGEPSGEAEITVDNVFVPDLSEFWMLTSELNVSDTAKQVFTANNELYGGENYRTMFWTRSPFEDDDNFATGYNTETEQETRYLLRPDEYAMVRPAIYVDVNLYSDLSKNHQEQAPLTIGTSNYTDVSGSWSSSDNSQTRPHYYCYDDTTSVSLLGDGVVNFGPGVWVDSNEPVNYNSFVYQEFCDRLEHDPVMAAAVFGYADKQLGTRYTGSFYSEIKDDWITGINNAAETFVNDMNLWAGETNAFEELLESTADISIIYAGGEEIQTLRMRLGDGQPLVYGPETLKTTAPWKYLCFTVHVKTTEITLSFLIDLGFQPVI